eukprot:CAMPEP_0179199482 /NCGR_PEP_ID=MMETSP0796-20121207/99246_1 /TAXON_ID=73915 /ORGANISM="Pyrodinium bahamense, Strain pbaha01" /LENGTH=79 /DNA_ID=CAMNT_0020903981 /DNA_START=63 /DNA_END=302 /DNA_ORIENTATION=+
MVVRVAGVRAEAEELVCPEVVVLKVLEVFAVDRVHFPLGGACGEERTREECCEAFQGASQRIGATTEVETGVLVVSESI